jgi:uroporphyrinogen-III decarboxylase
MTSKERYLCCLHRETPDKVPILHWSLDLAQALSGVPMHQFAFDPEKMALGTIRYVEKYKPDVTSVNYDVFHQLEPFGLEVHITDSLIYPKKTLADRNRPDPKIYEELEYRSPFAGKRTQVYRKACQIVTEELGDKVAFRSGGYGPTSNLALLVGVKEALRDAVLFPEAFLGAAERVMMDWTVDFATGLLGTFKDKVACFCYGFASLDGDLLPAELKDEVARLEVEALNRIREKIRKITGRDVPISTHICGTRPQLEFLAEKFGDAIDEFQYWIGSDNPLEDVVEKLGDRYVITTGIDHTRTMILGNPVEVDAMAKSAIDIAKGRCSFVLSSGCELGIMTPEGNLLALLEARDKYGTY